MRKLRYFMAVAAVVSLSLFIAACGKKETEEGPVEETLTAVSLDQLEEGNFYVRSGDSYYKLPLEECNFDISKDPKSKDNKQTGMMATGLENNRVVDFVYQDNAIPTLYQNDTLVYVTKDEISSFTWERFLDCGYSVGVYGFELNNSNKITTGELSNYAKSSSMSSALVENGIQSLGGIVFDKINGTPLSKDYLNESAGIITGMSKDAPASIDAFIGTTHVPMNAIADTKYFQSFELFNSTQYSLSTDGYAIVEIPNYLKSGYYLLNNKGFVKYLSIDRGNDEASLDLTVPYYYEGEDGKVLTYYEWREQNGYTDEGIKKDTSNSGNAIDVTEYPERMKFTTDSSAVGLNVNISYKYKSDNAMQTASQTGEFPRAVLVDPYGTVTPFENNEEEEKSSDGSYTMKLALDSAPCGDWYILFRNFDNAYKEVDTELVSGNATTYIHSGTSGNISIYYEGSTTPQTIHATWEQSDRTATDASIQLPDGTRYTMQENPEMFNSFAGGIDITLPSMAEGSYKIDLKGDTLGRVWFTKSDAASAAEVTETAAAEDETETESTAAGTEKETKAAAMPEGTSNQAG